MKKRSLKKLAVNRETLQNLDEKEQQRLPGGASAICTSIPCIVDTQCGATCTCW